MSKQVLTIGRLAKAAGVGIETIRYYQRRGLLPVPSLASGAFRQYPVALVDRIGFIKRAQDLGFSLEEISELLALGEGDDRPAIRDLAGQRVLEIRARIEDLKRMEAALSHLIHECEGTQDLKPCPIISTLAGETGSGAGIH
ncbi:MAG: MerR family DNA-binding protein [Burkholderiaceae bacterium]|jgi:MerR family mercuric resistance operon transcriptional regulator